MTYIIMAQPKRSPLGGAKTLSYGIGKEPAQNELLFRNRATAFDTEEQAWDALETSLKISEANGGEWVRRHLFFLVEVVRFCN